MKDTKPTGHAHDTLPAPAQPQATVTTQDKMLKLGELNAQLAPLQITADGLASLGFSQAGTARASKLYRVSDMPAILMAIINRLHIAKSKIGGAE